MRSHLAWLLIPSVALSGYVIHTTADPRRDVQAVLDSIAIDLTANNRASLAARYDRRGAILLGHGRLRRLPFDSMANVYGDKWSPPVRFDWRNITIDVLNARSAVVYAQFMWYDSATDSSLTSYTGVLVHDGKGWRVRSEHESWPQVCPADTASK